MFQIKFLNYNFLSLMIELYELNPHKMTTPQEKAQCVSWFIETKSDVQTQ